MIFSAQASAMRLELYPQPIGKIFSDDETFKKGVVLFGGREKYITASETF